MRETITMDTGLTISVSGKDFPVHLETDQKAWVKAKFTLHLGEGNDVGADTFAELEAKVKDLRIVRFELPFTDRTGKDGTVTGFHATNGNMLIRWANGKTIQEYGGSGLNDAMPRLDEADKAALKQLIWNVREAQKVWNDFVEARKFESVRDAANEARRLAGGVSA